MEHIKFFTHITTASASTKQNRNNLRAIINSVEKCGGKVLENWLFRNDTHREKRADFNNLVFEESRKAIRDSDVLIAECSYPSTSVGVNIGYAVELKTPVLCLYLSGNGKHVGKLVKGFDTSLVQVAEYNTQNIYQIVCKFVKQLTKQKIKYSVYLNNRQSKYLEWLASKSNYASGGRMGQKSNVIRNMIDHAIEEDKGYKSEN